jgi:hypothetical protein
MRTQDNTPGTGLWLALAGERVPFAQGANRLSTRLNPEWSLAVSCDKGFATENLSIDSST